jgi:hypothetical protein
VLPHVRAAWGARGERGFVAAHGRPPADRHELRRALLSEPVFQTWSALRRMTMEQRQQAGRWVTLRQADKLAARAKELTDGDSRLELDPSLAIPRYISAIDNHCMPGSYHAELFEGDVSGAANYDHGLFATTGGQLGRFSDGGGHGVVQWMRRHMRDWDAFYNTEPFWSTMHGLDLDALVIAAGFARENLLHGGVTAVVDKTVFPDAADDTGEDFGRKAAWHIVGARR